MPVEKKTFVLSLFLSGLALVLLIGLTLAAPPAPAALFPALLFLPLIVFTTTFGVPLGGGYVSLLPMTTGAAFLVTGPVPTAWIAWLGALIHIVVRYRWAEQLEARQFSLERTAITALANAAMQALAVLASGFVYHALGQTTPLTALELPQILPMLLSGLTYLAVNHIIASIFIRLRGIPLLRHYLRSLPSLLAFEGAPSIFAPLMALLYTRLGLFQFLLFALILVIASLITRRLDRATRRLERRVQELNSLQAVGQALSASLDIEAVISAIYEQVRQLMPAQNFYVALYDAKTDEVTFPLAVEEGKRVQWRSRRTGKGLTEHILRTQAPLLIRGRLKETLDQLGIEQIGRPAASWLGVPLMAAAEPIGIIAVQSYDDPAAYDSSHLEILTTIASQAAVAIQNARLYARTDEALARRVQEMDSILRTTQEGILLLDTGRRIVAVNRALTEFFGVAQLELLGQQLEAVEAGGQPLIELMGYTSASLAADCALLTHGEVSSTRREAMIPGPTERYLEHTLTPVRDRHGAISGWLMVLRDVTEERELARLREDLIHMLVHDLRSPLTAMQGSLEMIDLLIEAKEGGDLSKLVTLARRSNQRMLRMVNDLLDVSKLESGKMVIHPQKVTAAWLLEEARNCLAPLIAQTNLDVQSDIAPDLPPLYVDPDLIGRVVVNLLDNAIKFTPDGGEIRLWARRGPDSEPATLLLGVRDTGPGIPLHEQSRLFKKFQAASIRGRRVGTGLGLPFCKLAVEAHGGRIWVESEEGIGSTFSMLLPVAAE